MLQRVSAPALLPRTVEHRTFASRMRSHVNNRCVAICSFTLFADIGTSLM